MHVFSVRSHSVSSGMTLHTLRALCAVIKSSELQKKSNEIWVVTSEAHVCTRFFFV